MTAAPSAPAPSKLGPPLPESPATSVARPAYRLAGLDALCGIAVLLVVGAHFNLGVGQVSPSWLEGGLRRWQALGWSGVDLFFVLSGFLISGLLFHEYSAHGRVQVGRFLIRRGLKIYPSFWVMILYTVAAMAATGHAVSLTTLGSELYVVAAVLFGAFMTRVIERPALAWRDRHFL